MPFTIRPYRRLPVFCPVTYQTGLFEGHGTVWNLSLTGWRFSGNLPLRVGEVCSLTVNLSIDKTIYVTAGIVRWRGLVTLAIDYGMIAACPRRTRRLPPSLSTSIWPTKSLKTLLVGRSSSRNPFGSAGLGH